MNLETTSLSPIKTGEHKMKKIIAKANIIRPLQAAIFIMAFTLTAQTVQAATYVITDSEGSFPAEKDGSEGSFTAVKDELVTVGTADQPIQTVIDAIKADAAGQPCTIQFANVDIRNKHVAFDGSGIGWGLITLTGAILSSGEYTIYLSNGVSIESMATILNLYPFISTPAPRAGAFYNASTGTVNISGGGLYAIQVAFYNASTGTVNISGGTLSVADVEKTYGVYNASTGTVNISGGEVSATNGRAVDNNGGTVNISGGKVLATTGNAVYNNSTGTVNISSGEVSATTGYAVSNASTGTVSISGGEVSATNGRAVSNAFTGTVSISGGEVSATNGRAVYNDYTGKITVSGTAKITSANASETQGTIYLQSSGTATDTRLEITGGTVENTYKTNVSHIPYAHAVYNASTGTVSISGGKVSTTGGNAVHNASTGTVNIRGGTLSANSYGIFNNSTGTVNISGGTVEQSVENRSTGAVNISGGTISTIGYAVYNLSRGKITVSGTAKLTSQYQQTIRLSSDGKATDTLLEITGGTVENRSIGDAVTNYSAGAITISGGMLLAKNGYAINTSGTGTATITGGLMFAYGTGKEDVINGNYTTPSGNAVIMAWNKEANNTAYAAGTSSDIFKLPSAASAKWLNKNSEAGIDYAYSANAGFLAIGGITVGKANPPAPTGLTATVGQTLASVSLPAGWAWANATASVGAVGVRTHKANYPQSDENFNAVENIDVSVEVRTENTPIHPPQIAGSSIRVQATANAIVLENLPKNTKVEVYSMQGKRIYFSNSENSKILKIQVQTKGIYVVKAANQTSRVAVR